jgi:pimeloyl-ACP methyl ester carboxylesterase
MRRVLGLTGRGWLAVAVLLSCGARAEAAAASRVSLTTEDGVVLSATLWEPDGRVAAGVLMVHAPSRTSHDFDRIGDQLGARGFLVLSLDLRGHGDSQGTYATTDLQAVARDVSAAIRYLLTRQAGTPAAIGIIGASAGATLGVLAANGVPAVKSFALLSAPLDFRGLRLEEPLRRVGDRAVLVVASGEDVYAARCARALAETGPGLRELMLLDSAGHATKMLTSRPDLLPSLVDWFSRTLL